ncbi:hypothetical protein [Gilliamella sp. Pas-s95]|uniref:hypothetical protein n=1 Tax=Gilliamella sp. Pas-s95 TaxID=2687317 RepID=UPI00132AE245|nr:hypothetical protein [Gilliamella sp. Pas-s95]MWN05467.1 hypothetical protein [Gilliamella sp. Pas-s95]
MAYGIWHMACQTYALNFFHFHRSPKPALFTFLLPSLAKLSDLSAIFSSRTRHLSKLLLAFAPLLLLPYSGSLQALSVQSQQVIQGSAPYLSIDGVTKVASMEDLLGIRLPNISYIPQGANSALYPNATIDQSNVNTPIEMSNITDTFADIQTIVPLVNYPEIQLNDLVVSPYNYGHDDDGDDNINATGQLTIKWQDKNGTDITGEVKANPNKRFNLCDGPYKLTLTATAGTLSTQYGVPNSSTFTGNAHSYYISGNMNRPVACYAQPNLAYDDHAFGTTIWDMDGPNWVLLKGFKITNNSNIAENFPTTGSDRLYFYLLLGGISPEQVIAANGTTVSAVSGSGVSLSLSKENTQHWAIDLERICRTCIRGGNLYPGGDEALKIVLKGPSINSSNKAFSPSLFKLYSDVNHTKLLYSFKIERWYISQPGSTVRYGYADAQNFCRSLGNGYRIPDINDYTNGNGAGWTEGLSGRSINNCQRKVSYKDISGKWVGGLFNEWGFTANTMNNFYEGSDWNLSIGNNWANDTGYWANSYNGSLYSVYSADGGIVLQSSANSHFMACVAP